MADVIRNERIITEFLPVIGGNLTRTLDIVIKNGVFQAKDVIVVQGTREINAPSAATATEADRIADGKARKSVRGTVSNTCEIITKYVSLTDTETALEKVRLAKEIEDAVLELKQDFNYHLWNGTRKDIDPRAMDSILRQIPTANKISKAKANFAKQDFVDAVLKASKAGIVTTVFGGYDTVSYLADVVKATQTSQQNSDMVNLDTNIIIVNGQKLEIVTDEAIPDNTLVLGNPKYLEFYLLNQLRQLELARTGRVVDYMVDMEATVLLRNPKNFVSINLTTA
ncbi:hypothetical protein SAMN05428976_10271 [Clostridium sp. USBA 49]|uniref:SU10 major capsid protein n=1 Tax=Clostridium sp. USBA 49 TaxID=1881060 RepID=UPI0009994B70|nr:DUF5309 family protein [Clostridium sp. USBA 49]SKA75181.1 hypothetical protein SAMN05428976_10271 [Clostridium sp. USBA 49]